MSELAGKSGNKGGGSKPKIGDEAKGRFLDGLRRGARHEEAAREAGFARSSFYRLKGRDPHFARLWDDAIAHSSGPRYVCPGKGRQLQLRRNRNVAFTDARKAVFRDHFAGTCNLAAAAEAAGVCELTIYGHLAKDPGFAANFRADLQIGYLRLEAEVVRRRLEAQKRLRKIAPTGEPEPEFEAALKLLQRWDRKDGTIGPRAVGHGKLERWDFDDAMVALDKRLRALGARSVPPRLPPPDEPPAGEPPAGEPPEEPPR